MAVVVEKYAIITRISPKIDTKFFNIFEVRIEALSVTGFGLPPFILTLEGIHIANRKNNN